MKSILFSIFLFGSVLFGFSQDILLPITDHELIQKYWYYRWRLRNDFVYIGDQPGESLPIEVRHVDGPTSGYFTSGDGTQQLAFYILTLSTELKLLQYRNEDLEFTKSELYYAIKTFERLDLAAEPGFPHFTGNYFDSGNNVLQPINEIQNANNSNGYPQLEFDYYLPSLDGYFQRSDFPRDFFGDEYTIIDPTISPNWQNNYAPWASPNQFAYLFSGPCSHGGFTPISVYNDKSSHAGHLNENLTSPSGGYINELWFASHDWFVNRMMLDPYNKDGTCNTVNGDISVLFNRLPFNPEGTFFDQPLSPNSWSGYDFEQPGGQPSTDQIGTLLEAFLVLKASLVDQSELVKLKDGTTISYNFVQAAKNNTERILNRLRYSTGVWRIQQPNGENVDSEHGGDAGQYAFPLAQIGNFTLDFNVALPYFAIPSGFHNLESIGKYGQWQSYKAYPALPEGNTWNSHSDILHFAAVSDSWRSALLGPFSPNITKGVVKAKSSKYAWDSFLMLLNSFLHGGDMNFENVPDNSDFTAEWAELGGNNYISYTKYLLESAPCTGPFSYQGIDVNDPNYDVGTLGWNTSKRWYNPYYAQRGRASLNTNQGEDRGRDGYYNGLDFMALFNLYYLQSDDLLPEYVNYIERHYNESFPNSLAANNPFTIGAYETLTSDSEIEDQLEVYYLASKTITLKPGFTASNGAEFNAKIEPVVCGTPFRGTEAQNGTSYGLRENVKYKNYQDIRDKFAHLKVLPDSIELARLIKEESVRQNPVEDLNVSDVLLDIRSFPNPSADIYVVEFNRDVERGILSVRNLLGELIYQSTVSGGQLTFNIENHAPGIYIVTVEENSNKASCKIVKQ